MSNKPDRLQKEIDYMKRKLAGRYMNEEIVNLENQIRANRAFLRGQEQESSFEKKINRKSRIYLKKTEKRYRQDQEETKEVQGYYML